MRSDFMLCARALLLTLLAPLLALTGCSALKAAPGPTIVLIGGGLEADNEPVLSACIDRQSRGVIVLVPWASGDQAGAAGNATKMFSAHAPGATIVVAPDPETDAAGAVAAIERVMSAGDLLYFTGGDQSRITKRVLAPERAALLAKMREVAARPGVILGGTSAGAAVMSDPMFTGGRSDAALNSTPLRAEKGDDEDNVDDEPKVGPRLAPGLGLVKDVIVDTHFAQRGRLGRLIAAVEKSGAKLGIGLNENRAAVSDGWRFFFTGGSEAVIAVGLAEMRREGEDRLGVRVHLFNGVVALLTDPHGAEMEPAPGLEFQRLNERGEIIPMNASLPEAQFKLELEGCLLTPKWVEFGVRPVPMIAGTPEKASRRGPWAKNEVVYMLRRLAAAPEQPQVNRGEHFELTLRCDRRTSFASVEIAGQPQLIAINVIADVRRVR